MSINLSLVSKPKREYTLKKVGNYLLISNDNRILLTHKKQALFHFSFESRTLAEDIANRINTVYGVELGYLGYESWLSGIQQIHMTMPMRYKFGYFIDELTKLNRTITKADLLPCAERAGQEYQNVYG